MSVKRDYYEILGLPKTADQSAIKKAYRKLAKRYHPDTNAGDKQAEKMFKDVTEAYSVLSDPEKKKLYDQFGHAAFDQGGGSGYGPFDGGQGAYNRTYGSFNGGGGFREYHFENGDMDDIFQKIFGDGFSNGFGGGFDSGFRGGYSGGFNTGGEDLRAQIEISFDEAVFGCDKVITLEEPHNGARRQYKVHIPAGIDTGKSVRLRGKGKPGRKGDQPGDLLLRVSVGEKKGYERKGMDIYTTVQIPYTTAVFGGEAVVKTLYGNVLCKIKEGTQSGSKIRLKGKGIVSMKDPSVYGDQYVTVQIAVPRNLNREAREKLKEFEAAYGRYAETA